MARFEDREDGLAQQHQKLLATGEMGASSDDDNNPRIIYVKEKRRSRWWDLASWLSCFFLGIIAATLMFGVTSRQSQLSVATAVAASAAASSSSSSSSSQQPSAAEQGPAAVDPKLKQTYKFADTDALPIVPNEIVTFEADRIFSDRATDESDFAWDMLLPQGHGWVFVPDAAARGLLPGQLTSDGEIYSVALYHQLHCLARIRKLHWIFKDGITTGDDRLARDMAGRTQTAHAQHCFDYLRQSIMCYGDMTLEWPKQEGPSAGAQVDGWGVPHVCKSPSAIKDYMDEYHFNSTYAFDAAG